MTSTMDQSYHPPDRKLFCSPPLYWTWSHFLRKKVLLETQRIIVERNQPTRKFDFSSKFHILEKIGEGTFAEVLKCQNKSTGQFFAVKRLKKELKHIRETKNISELVVLQNLPPHPNVLTLLESIFDPTIGKLFMIFELMEMNLYDLIQKRKRCLPESKVKHLFYQILKGVEHLHSHGLFHRDIKPENILIKKTTVKLADLGSVRGVHSQPPYTEYISTRWYRAPECILTSGTYGPKMDIWACGCVFFELLTSKPMFPGANEIDQLTRIHQVVGTPTPRVLMKMRRSQCRVGDVKFSPFPSINLAIVLPFTTESARDLLKRMLMYDPDIRANVQRLLDHKYFNDLKEAEFLKQLSSNYLSSKPWHNALLLGGQTGSKKPKPRSNMSNISTSNKKKLEPKLTTSSWAPLSKTSKVSVTQSMSKPNNKVSPSKPNVRKKVVRSPKPSVKKTSQNVELLRSPTRIPVKIQNMKATTVGILPSLGSRQSGSIKVTKSHVTGSSFKTSNPRLLPPIQEQ